MSLARMRPSTRRVSLAERWPEGTREGVTSAFVEQLHGVGWYWQSTGNVGISSEYLQRYLCQPHFLVGLHLVASYPIEMYSELRPFVLVDGVADVCVGPLHGHFSCFRLQVTLMRPELRVELFVMVKGEGEGKSMISALIVHTT